MKEITRITDRRRSINQEVSRKLLEVEAAEYGVDTSGYSLDHLKKLVAGARSQWQPHIVKPADQLYYEALSTVEAQASTGFYRQRLITDMGMQVKTSETDMEELETSKRQYIQRRRNRRNRNENQD